MALTALERTDGCVARISLTDPTGRNAIDEEMRAALSAALKESFDDPDIRAIVIMPEGDNFSVGGDLGRIANHPAGQASHSMMRSAAGLAMLVASAPKPIVAAVRGHCIGAGAGLALLCDCVIMERGASMGFPFLRIGLVPDFGTSWSLPQRIGIVRARQALIAGKSFSGVEALEIGLVDEIAEDGAIWESAGARARAFAKAPAAALHQLRLLLRDPPLSLPAALEAEALNQALCFGSPDLAEGLAAFQEKRKPDFITPKGGS